MISNLIGDINSLSEIDDILGLIKTHVDRNPDAFRQYEGTSILYENLLRLQLRKQNIDVLLALSQDQEAPADFLTVENSIPAREHQVQEYKR